MIYCVEDDDEIRNLITYTLNVSGFQCIGFESAPSFYEAIKNVKPELIMLDIMLPGEDGISILKKIKSNENYRKIPIIMATAKGTEYDRVVGLDLGADDYLSKPFGMMEMVARVKAVLRRSEINNPTVVLRNGTIEMNQKSHMVYVNKEIVSLTLKEYDLLLLFMENKEKVFSRDEILTLVWGMEFIGESRTIDVHIGTLRTKLKDEGYLIETVRGVGYRMVIADEKENI